MVDKIIKDKYTDKDMFSYNYCYANYFKNFGKTFYIPHEKVDR